MNKVEIVVRLIVGEMTARRKSIFEIDDVAIQRAISLANDILKPFDSVVKGSIQAPNKPTTPKA